MDEQNPPSDLGELIAQQQYEEQVEGQGPEMQTAQAGVSRRTWIIIAVVAGIAALAVLAYYLIQRYGSSAASVTPTSAGSGGGPTSLPLAPSAGTSEGSANPNAGTVVPNAPSTDSGVAGELASSANNSSVSTVSPPSSVSTVASSSSTQTRQAATTAGTSLPYAVIAPLAGTNTTIQTPGSGVSMPAQSYQVTTPQGTQSYVATPGGFVEGTGAGAMALSQQLGLQQYLNNSQGR